MASGRVRYEMGCLHGQGVLKWSQCDEDDRSALILACHGGHTRLALRLLDEINIEEYAIQNHPFHVLKTATEFGHEVHALAIGEHPKIQTALGAANLDSYKRCAGVYRSLSEHTITECAELAIQSQTCSVLWTV